MVSAASPDTHRAPHLVLVGMMGAGKTSIGRRVAKRLHLRQVDLDVAIERRAGASVSEIFASEGEAGFREREHAVLVDILAGEESLVVSTGGGAVLRTDNRDAMRSRATVVWLRATPRTLLTRVGDGSGRPLLADDPLGNLTRLAESRAWAYAAAAHEIIDVDRMSSEAVTEQIARVGAALAATMKGGDA